MSLANFGSSANSVEYHLPSPTPEQDLQLVVKHFQLNIGNVKQVTGQEVFHSKIGSVFAVRSSNVPEYGDHYIIITGFPVMKPHGLRPQNTIIPAGNELSEVLDEFTPTNGVILLELNEEEKQRFLEFHNIEEHGV